MYKTLRILIVVFVVTACLPLAAQEVWTADRCMQYAVEHNRSIREKALQLDSYRQDLKSAWGSFLPSLNASVTGQMNFGRSVDPETNTYNTVSTFNNNYSLETSWAIFRGGSLVNEVKRSRAQVWMGKATLDAAREQIALETYDAYIQVLYLKGCMELSNEKLKQTDSLLYKTEAMEKIGLKSMADVSQIKAQQAADRYTLVQQTHAYDKALLNLGRTMSLDSIDSLCLDTTVINSSLRDNVCLSADTPEATYTGALLQNPTLLASHYQMQGAKQAYRQSLSGFLPSLMLYGGISTSYYKMLSGGTYPTFNSQFRNNLGQYIAVSLSIPIFNRFNTLTNRRKARNAYYQARLKYEEEKVQLNRLIREAYMDRNGSLAESMQLEDKVQADNWAFETMRRKYEEGLATSLEVQQNATTLHDTRLQLLKSRLTYQLKCRLVEYYQGKSIIAN